MSDYPDVRPLRGAPGDPRGRPRRLRRQGRAVRRRGRRGGPLPAGGRRRAAGRRTSTPRTCPRSTAAPAPTRSPPCSSSRRSPAPASRPRLIPAVNKLGSLPVQIAGSEELKKKYLTKLAAGEGGFSYCLSEPDAGSDAGGMKTRAVRDGDELGAQRREALDHQRRRVGVLHRHGGHRPREADPRRHLRLRRGEVRRGRLLRCAGEEARHQGLARPARSTSTTSASPPTG